MTEPRWQRLSQVYDAALALAPDARAGFLESACGGDWKLRADVESLLRHGLPSTPAIEAMAAVLARSSAPQVGSRMGPYRIDSLIGEGGMGQVYRARDQQLQRDVAIKVLPPVFALDANRRARFEREARVLASLNHPHIAAIYGLVEGEGHRGLVLELVEGETLAERLQRGAASGAGLPLAEVVGIARLLVEALDAAHERGIVHRDLKPANIKISSDGVVKVLDFGLATAVARDGSGADLTRSPTITVGATGEGVLLGTAPYMSPEQARGQAVDKRTDIWAFGCVLYEMLTGRAAFAGATLADTLAAIVGRDPDWRALPDNTPAGLAQMVRRCLEKNLRRRLRDIGDAFSALDEEAKDARELVVGTASPRLSARLAWSAAALILAVAISAVVLNRSGGRTPVVRLSKTADLFSLITSDDSFSTEPAISRDGSLVAYASDRAGNGQLDLWLQHTSGGPPIQLTFNPADDREPSFSPDGSRIAFRSDRDGGGIYVMNALAGETHMPAQLVVEGGRGPRFSPDRTGTRIAYWSGGAWLAGPRGDGFKVFIVSANGGRPSQVAEGFRTATMPIWSPDGRSLLFFGRKSGDVSAPSNGFDWWWAALDDGQPVATRAYKVLAGRGFRDIDGDGELAVLPSAWTSTGVLFSARRGETSNLWRLGVSQRDGSASEGTLEPLTSGTGANVLPASDEAGRIVFQAADEAAVSLTLKLEPNTGKVLESTIVRQTYDAGGREARNSLDQTGRLLAFARIKKDERQFWVKDLKTGQERPVISVQDGAPTISPDGTTIAYVVSEKGVQAGYTVRVSGGMATKLCEPCILHGWLHDSRRILATHPADSRVIVIDTADNTTQDLIVRPSIALGRLILSKDERWLAIDEVEPVGRNSQGPLHIWLAPVHPDRPSFESEWVKIRTKLPGSAERACGWSPDGQLLYLLLERDGFRDLYAQRIDRARGTTVGQPFLVQPLNDPRRRWGSTPLGSAIVSDAFVFNQVEQTGQIWLLDLPR
ncbi:MAG TPA: protein kinase [Vicinamibacterales bacterium]|nr:protein kinase [Vicinamibacterales bacterium]